MKQFVKYAWTAYKAYRGDPDAAGQIVGFLFTQIRAREIAGLNGPDQPRDAQFP